MASVEKPGVRSVMVVCPGRGYAVRPQTLMIYRTSGGVKAEPRVRPMRDRRACRRGGGRRPVGWMGPRGGDQRTVLVLAREAVGALNRSSAVRHAAETRLRLVTRQTPT